MGLARHQTLQQSRFCRILLSLLDTEIKSLKTDFTIKNNLGNLQCITDI
jgi:hypothetical protein